MKSDRAQSTEVRTETYCRHGFHEWFELSESDSGVVIEAGTKALKCKHCGKIKKVISKAKS